MANSGTRSYMRKLRQASRLIEVLDKIKMKYTKKGVPIIHKLKAQLGQEDLAYVLHGIREKKDGA